MRKVVVLAEAAEDIEQARNFYDAQEPGVGDYCADSLVADIESLALYHGTHSRHFGFCRMLAGRLLSAFTIAKPKQKRRWSPFLICAVTPIGLERN
jgi:hypothetical protein